jgi:hypothetical protein
MPSIIELAEMERQVFGAAQQPQFDSTDAKFAKFLLENDNVPKGMLELFWPFFDKEIANTNFEKADVDSILLDLNIAILNFKMSHPDFEMTYEEVTNLDMMRPKAFMRAMRSTGGVSRERALQATQIRQLLGGESQAPQGGIMSSLGGLIGGKKK